MNTALSALAPLTPLASNTDVAGQVSLIIYFLVEFIIKPQIERLVSDPDQQNKDIRAAAVLLGGILLPLDLLSHGGLTPSSLFDTVVSGLTLGSGVTLAVAGAIAVVPKITSVRVTKAPVAPEPPVTPAA